MIKKIWEWFWQKQADYWFYDRYVKTKNLDYYFRYSDCISYKFNRNNKQYKITELILH